MSLQCGIVGLPNVGKSTLFNALTKAGIAAENYPFCTIEPNVGVVEVPDPRLGKLPVRLFSATIHASFRWRPVPWTDLRADRRGRQCLPITCWALLQRLQLLPLETALCTGGRSLDARRGNWRCGASCYRWQSRTRESLSLMIHQT